MQGLNDNHFDDWIDVKDAATSPDHRNNKSFN